MSTQNLLLIVAVGVVIVGSGWYYFKQANTDSQKSTAENTEPISSQSTNEINPEANNEPLTGEGSFAYLLGLGRDLTCDFSYSSETGGTVAGTVYISDKHMRGDFDLQQDGQLYESHMIQTDDMMYTWTKSPTGIFAVKFPVDKSEADKSSDTTPNRPVSLDQNVDYDCGAWQRDEAFFVPPPDITFTNQETMMPM